MRPCLLDVNVLVALAWPTHVHHESAHAWFATLGRARWATCPATQAGFVRVSSNARVLPNAKSPAEALGLLRRIAARPGHEFWPDDTNLATTRFVSEQRLVSHGQVTDAHVLALCLERRGCLVTFDGGVRSLVPPQAPAGSLLVLGTGSGKG